MELLLRLRRKEWRCIGAGGGASARGDAGLCAPTGKLLADCVESASVAGGGKIYELWILQPDGKKPLPAGTFAPDSTGTRGDDPGRCGRLRLTVQDIGITVENAAGRRRPTLPDCFIGAVKLQV